ncbi:hypothetical protein BpHYR1_019018 [Brachionus plicatilis]|uniref:Uncharacterized protein n=1 Tax=Brachionus plicatilis TaxID=10195 RepID=A0A3M7T9B2_BRAPC|nr:hypothetical protein BpHYR1_019018 [Brachionus plicatilis]
MPYIYLFQHISISSWCSERDSIFEETEQDKDFDAKFDHYVDQSCLNAPKKSPSPDFKIFLKDPI